MTTIATPKTSRKIDTETILNFLNKYKTQDSITSLLELEGLLMGWACSPCASTQDLLDNIYGEEEPEIDSIEEIGAFFNAVFAFHNLSLEALRNKKYRPFFLKQEEDLQIWCKYFAFGFGAEPYSQDTIPENIMFSLMCIVATGVPENKEMFDQSPEDWDEFHKMVNSFKVKDFAKMAQNLYLFGCEQRVNNTPSSHKTPGRNDPCICGSGKKFKKCCLQ